MRRIVLIKEGEYRPNLFSDFTETVNQLDVEQVGFYTRHDYTFRLTRNQSTIDTSFPLALAHYNVNVASVVQDPTLFRPVNTELIFTALDTYDYIMVGCVTKSHLVTDQSLLPHVIYIARDNNGKLINVETCELIQPDGNDVTLVTTFFGVVRMTGLPLYTIILNSSLTHATDGFDYDHRDTDTMYRLVTDHDGSVKSTVFSPSITGATQIGDTLLSQTTTTSIAFFDFPSVLHEWGVPLLNNVPYTIQTDLEYRILDDTITLTTERDPARITIHQFSITFNCGLFYDIVGIIEKPTFSYLVIIQ